MRGRGAGVVVVVLAALVVVPVCARAQEALTENDFAIDVFTGPVLGSGRIVGLGGAFTALAEGIDGAPWNPASYASRSPWELSWFQWDIAFSILFPGSFSRNDFDNNGESGFTYGNFVFLTPGLRLQFGRIGVGGIAQIQLYSVPGPGDGPSVDVAYSLVNYGVGYALFDGQLVLGLAGRTAVLDIAQNGTSLVQFASTGIEIGVHLGLSGRPWRLGVAARTPTYQSRVQTCEGMSGCPVQVDPVTGVHSVDALVLPRSVHIPWQFQAGVAFMIGRRPLNIPWVNPHVEARERELRMRVARTRRELSQRTLQMQRAQALGRPATALDWQQWRLDDERWLRAESLRRSREEHRLDVDAERVTRLRRRWLRRLPRRYLLVSADVLLTGPTRDGVGLESFLSQRREVSGRDLSVEPRLGAEGEPWPNRLKLRAGTYLEPSRFDGVGYRPHGTAGFDFRLFSWDLFGLLDEFDFRVSATIDVAPRYLDWGISVGMWH